MRTARHRPREGQDHELRFHRGQFGRREPQRVRVLGVDRHELRVTPRREPLSGGVRTDLREDVDLTDAILDGASGSVRIGPGTKGIGELECNNHIPHEVFFACGQQSDVAKLGTVKIKDLWPDLDEGYEASDRVYLTFNDNPEGEEQPGYVDYGEFSGGDNPDRPTSRAKHKIRVGRDVRGGQIQWIGAAYE